MRIWQFVLAVSLGCGNGNVAGTPDGSSTSDAAVADTAADATVIDDCPNRTAPVGEPQTPIATAEIRAGDVVIRTTLDIDLLAGIRYIDGKLTIDSTTLSEVTLPDLEAVRGALEIPTTGVTTVIDLPKLETVGGRVWDLSETMKELRAPRLETIGDALHAKLDEIDIHCFRRTESPSLTTWHLTLSKLTGTSLNLPRFERGNLRISDIPGLTALRLPSYTTGNLNVGRSASTTTNLPNLTTIELPALETAGELIVDDAPAVASITIGAGALIEFLQLSRLPQLTSLSWLSQVTYRTVSIFNLAEVTSLPGTFASGAVSVLLDGVPKLTTVPSLSTISSAGIVDIRNSAMTQIDLPNLTAVENRFLIMGNSNLTTLSAPLLDMMGPTLLDDPSGVRGNAKLPNCQATVIRDRVLPNSPGLQFVVSNNKSDACQ